MTRFWLFPAQLWLVLTHSYLNLTLFWLEFWIKNVNSQKAIFRVFGACWANARITIPTTTHYQGKKCRKPSITTFLRIVFASGKTHLWPNDQLQGRCTAESPRKTSFFAISWSSAYAHLLVHVRGPLTVSSPRTDLSWWSHSPLATNGHGSLSRLQDWSPRVGFQQLVFGLASRQGHRARFHWAEASSKAFATSAFSSSHTARPFPLLSCFLFYDMHA